MKHAALVAAALVLAHCAAAADWPNYLGPTYNNVSAETGLLKAWPEGGPEKLWEVTLGSGFAAPSIVGDRLYALKRIQSNQPDTPQKDVLVCLNATTGEPVWEVEADARTGKYGFPGTRTAPTIKDGRIFVIGPTGDLYAFSTDKGELLWRRNLLQEYQAKRPHWAVGQAPVVWQNLVICTPQGGKAGLAAFDVATGKPRWQARTGGGNSMSYSSPILATIDGVEQVLAITGSRQNTRTGGYDPKTGTKLWDYAGWQCRIPITAPLHLGGGRVFITGEYGAGSAMIQVTKEGDGFQAKQLFKTQACGAQIHQPFLVGKHLYANSNGNKRRDGFACIDLDGKLVWRTQRDPNFEKGGLLLAGGLVYAVNGTNGTLIAFKPTPEGFTKLGEAKFLGGKTAWAPMAFSGGKLYIRDQQKLVCLDIRAR